MRELFMAEHQGHVKNPNFESVILNNSEEIKCFHEALFLFRSMWQVSCSLWLKLSELAAPPRHQFASNPI